MPSGKEAGRKKGMIRLYASNVPTRWHVSCNESNHAGRGRPRMGADAPTLVSPLAAEGMQGQCRFN